MLVTLFALMATAFLNGSTAPLEELNYYPMTTIVVELDENTDSVICADFNGNRWSFEGIEDWCVNDFATMMMCDNGTLEIYDDIICDVYYDGWLEGKFGYSSN